jgi:outer membrane receptor protein involved in Fe transport
VKGSITSDIRFRADVTYRVVKNMHFFVNDTLVPLQNQFTAEYDDIDLITYHGQLVVQPTSSLAFSLDGKYYDYNVFALPKPWHRPQYELGLDLSARLASKFTMNAGIAVIGTRWVNNMQNEDGLQRIKPVADLNLRLNYNYSKAFSLFADLYNIAGRSYLIWNQYPSQRFNFMFGLTYKL